LNGFSQSKGGIWICFLKILPFLLVVFYVGLDLECPVKRILGWDCPTCGTTRAVLALVKGNLRGYFQHQPFAVPLCMTAAAVFWKPEALRIKYMPLAVLTAGVNAVWYVWRLLS